MTKFVELDAFDTKLIERARRNNLEPARITAEAVGLSESAVLRRMRRLRAEGVIVADVAVIDPARVEPRIDIHVLVEMATHDRDSMRAFQERLRASPEVQGAWDVTGDVSYLLTLAVRDMTEYESFCFRELTPEAGIKTFRGMIVIREVVAVDPGRRAIR